MHLRIAVLLIATLFLAACGGGGGDAPPPPPAPPANTAPTISGTPPATVDQDTTLSFTFDASDADGDSLTFTLENAPGWLMLDPVTGTLEGTPGNDDVGVFDDIVVRVSDGAFGDSTTFQIEVINVNDAPVLSGTPPTVVDQDALYRFSISAQDPDGDPLTFAVAGAPAWLAIDADTGELSGTPGNDDVGVSGAITVSASDGTATTAAPPFTIEVRNVNDPPQLTGTVPVTATEDEFFAFQLEAADPDGDALTYALSNAPAWLTLNAQTGALSGTPTNADVGIATGLVVSVTDGTLTDVSAPFDLEVINVNDAPTLDGPLPAMATEDQTFSFQFVASDDDGDAVTFALANAPAWATLNPTTGVLAGLPGNDDVGVTAGLVVTVSDGTASTSSAPFDLEVLNVNDAPEITGTAPASVDEGQPYTFMPSANDIDAGDTLTFSIANAPPWASFDTDTGTLAGTPSNADQGEYANVTIGVSDGTDTVSLDPFTITVVDVTTVTLSGIATDEPVAGAAIFVTFDGEELQADADGNGAWTVTLSRRTGEIDLDALVTLRAFGTAPEQTQVELVSVPGSLRQLVEAAGADLTLTAGEFPRLNVTHVSTARTLLLPDFNGGAAATDAATLARAETAIPLQLTLDTAALIKAIVDQNLIAVPDGQTVLGLLLPTGTESRQQAIDAVLLSAGLIDGNGERTPALVDALAQARAATLADGNATGGFDVDALVGSLIWADETAPGHLLRDIGAKSVTDLLPDGTGAWYRQRYEPTGLRGRKVRTDAIGLTWSLTDQTLTLTFDAQDALSAAQITSLALDERAQLTEQFGFAQELVDFISQAIDDGATVPDPLPVRTVAVARTAQAVSRVDDTVHALVTDREENDLDEVLMDLAWPGDLPRGVVTREVTRTIAPPPARAGQLADRLVSGQTWALPVRYDLGASGGTPPGVSVDLFNLRPEGFTTSGPLSGLGFDWQVANGDLVLTAPTGDGGTERFIYERLDSLLGVEYVLVTWEVDGEVQFRFTDWLARQGPSASELIDALVAPEPQYWSPVTGEPNFTGARADRSAAYGAGGVVDPQRVAGYLFGAAPAARYFEPGPADCLTDDTRGCFATSGIWTYAVSEDGTQLTLDGDFAVFDREITWELLAFDAGTGVATVLEFAFGSFLDNMGEQVREVRAPPRVNRIDLETLDDYPAELQDARDVGFLQN